MVKKALVEDILIKEGTVTREGGPCWAREGKGRKRSLNGKEMGNEHRNG